MNTTESCPRITEFSPDIIDRLHTIIQSHDESEICVISKTFSDIELFVNSYGQYVNFSVRITKPIHYIKPQFIGLPKNISNFEHPKLNKLIYDINTVIDNIQLQPENLKFEFYDQSENSVIYHCRTKLSF